MYLILPLDLINIGHLQESLKTIKVALKIFKKYVYILGDPL